VIVPDSALAVGALAFILVALLTEAMRRVAIRRRLLDPPRADGRHSHATPYLGGVAIAGGTVGVFAIATPAWDAQTLAIAGTAAVVCALGLIDDLRPLNPAPRVMVEGLCASCLVAVGVHADVFAGAGTLGRGVDDVGTVVWIVILTNSFNLLDNMDGAAASIALATSPFLALLALATGRRDLAVLLIAMSAGCAGFLVHNWAPARIFMGDSGALFLGWVLAASAALTCAAGTAATPAPLTAAACALLLLMFVAVVDTCTVIVSRRRAGRRWTQGGADHLAHRLQVAGLSPSSAALVLSATAAVMGILGLVVISGIVSAAGALAVAVAVGVNLVVLAQRVKVYGPDPQPGIADPQAAPAPATGFIHLM
jgi:UDP-GlcNAc:undecaprenyl-phosphate/decaprenyl-phosphate GlcNAc-1-phosphate transferase